MRVIQTENTVVEARNSIAAGADIIIARGLQASLIKQYTDVPVVEIVATAQEMALLVVKARQIVKKARPIIAVVGFQNMFCDMTYFETIYDIKLRTYFAANGSGLKEKAMEAVEDGADLMIGGDIAVETARRQISRPCSCRSPRIPCAPPFPWLRAWISPWAQRRGALPRLRHFWTIPSTGW